MSNKEQEAIEKAIHILIDGFNARQTLDMAFDICSSLCESLLEQIKNPNTRKLAMKEITLDIQSLALCVKAYDEEEEEDDDDEE